MPLDTPVMAFVAVWARITTTGSQRRARTVPCWPLTSDEAVLRESIGTLQTALLTRKIEADLLRYLDGIVKYKTKEAEDKHVELDREGRSRYLKRFQRNIDGW